MAKNNQDIESLTPVEHILKRPGMWIGATSPSENEVWVLDDEDKISLKKVTYTEGLLKVLNEAIDNSVDEGIKTNWSKSNKISVEISDNTFVIEDNGRGIPVKKTPTGEWQCVNAVCKPMSGSNFNDENRTTIGTNGVGVKGLNIFSKFFECVTCDGNGKMKITCKDNLSSEKHTELSPSEKTGTKITATPDFERFGVTKFTPEVITMVKTRLKFLSWFYPKCNFSFNKEKINIKSKELSALFPEHAVTISTPNSYICVYPSDEPYTLTYVNGISLSRGGTHADYIFNKVIGDIREKVSKKYKAIKPADIRNRLGFVIFFNNFVDCKFNSQTKEALTNSFGEVGEYIRNNQIDLDSLSQKILKEKEIISNITDLFRLKEEMAERKELAKLSKTKKEVESEKYFPPIGKTQKKYLMITEGFSAFSGISPILGRKDIGYYMLRGKPLNILELKPTKFMENREVNELVNILGLDITNPESDMNYEKVVILSDADSDGTAIAGLILTLFSRIAPKMLKEGRICRLETPLLIGTKGNKVEEYYFTFPEKSKMKKTLNYFYLKGLGSWTKERLEQVIAKEGGMEKLIRSYTADENYATSIINWFGKDTSSERKEALRGMEFHIDNA